MNEKKKSFLLNVDYGADFFDELSDEQAGKLIKMIFAHERGEEVNTDDKILKVIFNPIKRMLDDNREKYEETCEARRKAGEKGGRPPKEEKAKKANGLVEKAKKANGFSENQTKAKKADNDNDNDNDNDLLNTSCAEPPSVFITIPLNTGDEYPITEDKVLEYKKLYPAVDVEQELRNMRGWCIDNKSRRKTKSGVLRFVNGWLAREQDKGKASPPRAKPKIQSFPERDLDFNEIEKVVFGT